MLTPRPTRRGERGQVLIMALGFVVFFALVTTAVLQFADTVELQQAHSQSTSTAHAESEGGMLFAAQASAAQQSCVSYPAGSTGSLRMTTGDVVSYRTTACNPGTTADLLGDQCAVCITGQAGVTPALDVTGTLTAQGPIAISGDATSGAGPPGTTSTVDTSGGSESGFIACTGTCGPAAGYSPPAPNRLTAPIDIPAPSGLPTPPLDPDGWRGETMNGGGTLSPDPHGYGYLDLSNGTFTLEPGVYFLSGELNPSNATVTAAGPVLLYFLDHGKIDLDAGSTLSLQDGPIAGYQGVTVYFQPTDVASDGAAEISMDTNTELDVQGTVYAAGQSMNVPSSASVSVSSTGSAASGRLVVGSLDDAGTIHVTASPPDPGYCWVFDDSVTVTSGAGIDHGQVLVESDCSRVKSTGIISIAYDP